jgi:antitoxin component of MazEF toxin-antitoxin module
MPIVRKVVTVGASRGVTLPKSWIENIERESGRPMTEIAMEIDRKITIEPILKKERKKCEARESTKK